MTKWGTTVERDHNRDFRPTITMKKIANFIERSWKKNLILSRVLIKKKSKFGGRGWEDFEFQKDLQSGKFQNLENLWFSGFRITGPILYLIPLALTYRKHVYINKKHFFSKKWGRLYSYICTEISNVQKALCYNFLNSQDFGTY